MRWTVIYLLAALVAGALLFGWGYRRGVSSVEIKTEVRIDTVFYERPKPFAVTDITVSVNVPKLVFARNHVMLHADSGNVASNVASFTNQAAETVTICHGLEPSIKNYLNTDSVQIAVMERTLEYRDSTYYARVSGPVIGDLAPRLDWIETYNRTITRTVTKRSRFAVTAGVGVGYTPQGFQPTIGVQAGVVLWSF